MGKLFGTDGIRGVVNAGLDAPLAYRVGLAAAAVLAETKTGGRPLITIGKDTRISSDMLEGALIAGLCSAGADVMLLGVIPTPAVAYLTVRMGADAGIVISASHNPFEHNGIKIFSGKGFKLSDDLENKIEEIVMNHESVERKTHGDMGRVIHGEERSIVQYVDHLVSTVRDDLSGLRVLVDCANGAASAVAKKLFERFRAGVDIINANPNGVNINDKCGSTHLERLAAQVKAGDYDIGIAFDGDADRCLAVDENGETIDGDQIMAICALAMKARNDLAGDTVVATIMSNMGLHVFAKENRVNLVCADVGDRNVLEKMLVDGYALGGEQSGHMIFLDYATTGDGELTALQLLQRLKLSGKKASELASVCRRYPQVLVNVAVNGNEEKKRIMASQTLAEAVQKETDGLNGTGRVLVRPSGTEALIRVMVEAAEAAAAQACADRLAEVVKGI